MSDRDWIVVTAADVEESRRLGLQGVADAAYETLYEILHPSVIRPRGRPGWTARLFDSRLEEAQAATAKPWTDDRIAASFRGLAADGTVGVDPDTFRKLRRRRERGELPTS